MITVRFYEELNDFLPPEQRKKNIAVGYREPRSVKDLIEALNVPHTEVDLILANGCSVGFDYHVRDGDRIAVYPMFESFDIAPVSKLCRPPLRQTRFVADVHLGKLMRRLRLLGFDCLYNRDWHDRDLAQISADENRILLTRDRDLLKRAIVQHGIFLHSDAPDRQLAEVMRRLDLKRSLPCQSRCLICNGLLQAVAKESVQDCVPPRTYRYIHEYFRCDDCRKVYWKGTHWQRLEKIIRFVGDDD